MSNPKKFAVVLSGCGVYDGTEIHEATMTLYAIMKNCAEYEIFAPDIVQHHVVNHITGEEMNETRNVLIESARIARGNIKDLREFNAKSFDVLIFPGGFGVAKNLSTLAFEGPNCKVNNDVEKAVKDMIEEKKPIGALCISPAVLAKIIGDSVNITIGKDESTAQAIEAMGGVHQTTGHGEVVVDERYKLFTTPCYMLDASIVDIANGAENIVKAILELID